MATYSNPFAGAGKLVSITPGSSDLVDGVCKALWCGSAGTVNLIDETGATVTGFPLFLGINLIRVRQVNTGGTASNIWALY